jgi:hypothetical protein
MLSPLFLGLRALVTKQTELQNQVIARSGKQLVDIALKSHSIEVLRALNVSACILLYELQYKNPEGEKKIKELVEDKENYYSSILV